MKDYLKSKGISIYALSRKTKIPYSTLNDLINGKNDIRNVKVDLLMRLSGELQIPMEEIVRMFLSSADQKIEINQKLVTVSVRNKMYRASFSYGNEVVEIPICKVKEDTTYYLNELTTWKVENYLSQKRMEEYENSIAKNDISGG